MDLSNSYVLLKPNFVDKVPINIRLYLIMSQQKQEDLPAPRNFNFAPFIALEFHPFQVLKFPHEHSLCIPQLLIPFAVLHRSAICYPAETLNMNLEEDPKLKAGEDLGAPLAWLLPGLSNTPRDVLLRGEVYLAYLYYRITRLL